MRLTKLKKFGAIITSAYFLVLFTLAFTLPILSASAADYVPLATIPGITVENTTGATLSSYLTGMFKIGIAVAGVLAFLMIVWGGFEYLSTDAISGKEEGKERITRALGGLILALTSFIILNTINPKLVSLNLKFGDPAKAGKAIGTPDELTRQIQDEQKALMEKSVAEQDIKRTATVNDLKAKADAFRVLAATLPDSDLNKAGFIAEANRLDRLAEETDLQRVAALKSEQSTVNLGNASTQEQLTTALTQAGNNAQLIKDAYAKARTEFASDPARVAALSLEEMNQLAPLRKAAAFALIDRPPTGSVVNPQTGQSSTYTDSNALNPLLQEQINLIKAEQQRQLALLEKVQVSVSAGGNNSNITVAGVRLMKEKINTEARLEICQIRVKCDDKNLPCRALAGDVACTFNN